MRDHHLTGTFARPLAWSTLSGVFWIAGGLADGDLRLLLWTAAAAIEYVGATFGYPVPRYGHSRTLDYTISGEHMAERCQLFIILALGESILITGGQFGELPGTASTVAAFVVAFVASVAFWWIYFDRGAELAAPRDRLRARPRAARPDRLHVLPHPDRGRGHRRRGG